jgi:hypothetical protein
MVLILEPADDGKIVGQDMQGKLFLSRSHGSSIILLSPCPVQILKAWKVAVILCGDQVTFIA